MRLNRVDQTRILSLHVIIDERCARVDLPGLIDLRILIRAVSGRPLRQR